MAANRNRLSRYAPTARRAEIGARDDLVQRHAGRCLGTMNLLHEAGWYTEQDEATGLLLSAFLLPVLRDERDER